MKKILLLICFLTSLSALAQPSNSSQYQVQPARWKMTKPLWLDSGSYVKNIAKYSNQNRVCVFDSTTGKVGYRYISGSTNYNAGNGILIGSSIIYADTNLLWSTHGNSGAPNRSFGTTNNTSVRVITNNLLRFILDSNGRFGQGKYPTVQFDATSSSSYGMNLTSTLNSGSTDLRLSNDLSRGLRVTQFGSTATGNLCGVIAKANASQIRFGGGNDPIVLVGDGNSPVYSGNNTAITLTIQNINNRIGVKKQTPIFGLDVNGTLAVNLDSLPTATNVDSVVMVGSTGQFKKRPFSAFSGGSTYLAGNGLILGGTTFYIDSSKVSSLYGNSWGNGKFFGSSNNRSIYWRTNNVQRMKLDSIGYLWLWGSTSNSGLRMGYNSTDQGMIWSNNVTPSTSNFALNTRGDYTFLNATSNVYLGIGGSDKVTVNSTSMTVSHNVVMGGSSSLLILKGYTVATLPTGVIGATAFVTDASGPSYLATVVGGGSVKCPVFYDGTNWVCH